MNRFGYQLYWLGLFCQQTHTITHQGHTLMRCGFICTKCLDDDDKCMSKFGYHLVRSCFTSILPHHHYHLLFLLLQIIIFGRAHCLSCPFEAACQFCSVLFLFFAKNHFCGFFFFFFFTNDNKFTNRKLFQIKKKPKMIKEFKYKFLDKMIANVNSYLILFLVHQNKSSLIHDD